MQEKIIEELREELKEQIKENKELEKKVDGLVTVIDLVREYINKNKRVIRELYSTNSGSMKFYELCIDPDELLEILERVNESEVK